MSRTFARVCVAVLFVAATAGLAFAQTTGSINGTVSDNTGAVLPGVTITVSGEALMGVQTAVTNTQGNYRFPSLAPGTYTLTYEIAGFSTVRRSDIVVNIGFTATVDVQLQLASLQETVTVSGEAPIVDVTNSNVQTNFTQEVMSDLPNARDIWSLIGTAPGMMVTSFDIGGSRAGTQTGFSAYGYSGQVRVQVDGVNTTEGTGAAGFYYDYGSFEELQLGNDGNDASAATPGVQLNAVIKSGGNQFRGNLYFDYENESLQGDNVTDALQRVGIGQGTRILKYYDPNISVGGPIKQDKFWYFGSYRHQTTSTTVLGFPANAPSDFAFDTRLQNATYKLTYQLTPNNKIGHYIQMGRKLQPSRGAGSTAYLDAVYNQDSISYAGNIEWNSVVNPTFFFNTRVATFGYNWPNLPYGANGELNENLTLRRYDAQSDNDAGSDNPTRNNRRRMQFDWTGTWFRDDWLGANHSLKFGLVSEREGQIYRDEGYLGAYRTQFDSPASSGDFTVPYRVQIYNTMQSSEDWATHHGAFVNDQFQKGRATVNVGVRWDYYSSDYPDQAIAPSPFREFFYGGAALPNGYSIPATPYAGTWVIPGQSGIEQYSSFAPRLGLALDLFGTGKTTVKVNYGRFYFNTGTAGADVNPAQSINYTFEWADPNGDGVFQMNEFGDFVDNSGGTTEQIDPNKKHAYTDSYSLWFEHEIVSNVGMRVGYTYRTDGNNSAAVEQVRVASLYTEERTFDDPGADGLEGTADDGPPIVLMDIPSDALLPGRTIEGTVDGVIASDRSFDMTLTRRMSNRWSLTTNFIYNWDRDRGFVQNPNQERFNDNTVTVWSWKTFGTWQAPLGLVITPTLRHQGGDALARVVRVNLHTGAFNYDAERTGAYREDNIWIFDTRVEKRFELGNQRTLGLFFDAFNLGNSNAAQSQDDRVGRRTATVNGERVSYQRFLRPESILAPRIFRFGFKLGF